MLANITNGNVLVIKKMLRHKSVQNTMKFIQTMEFKEDDCEETVVTILRSKTTRQKLVWTKYDEMTINSTQMYFYQ